MLAAFAAAYMSTVATELNWGSSYLVNDFYRRFVRRHESDHHYVTASKISTMGLMIVSAAVSYIMHTVAGGWDMVVNIGAGTGAVYLLRWYWWRINAWSEISAMASAAVVSIALKIHSPFPDSDPDQFAKNLLLTVVITSVVWVAATYLTQPEPESKLLEFYRRVRPGVKGWGHVAAMAPEIPPTKDGWYNLMDWVMGCLMVYMTLFSIGKLLLGFYGIGLLFLAIAVVSGYVIYWDLNKRGWETLSGKE
jgi:Na+/proline symporter